MSPNQLGQHNNLNPYQNPPNNPESDLDYGDFEFSEENDSSSSSAEQQTGQPRMQQPEKDFMQIDGASDDEEDTATHQGMKRRWKDTSTASEEEDLEASTEPRKRQRTSEKSAAPAAPVYLEYDMHRDSDLIELTRQHGGKLMAAKAKNLYYSPPTDNSLQFRAALLCLKLQRVSGNIAFPDKDDFVALAFSNFFGCLKEACLANEVELVTQLLVSGMGKDAQEALSVLLAVPLEAGSVETAALLQKMTGKDAREALSVILAAALEAGSVEAAALLQKMGVFPYDVAASSTSTSSTSISSISTSSASTAALPSAYWQQAARENSIFLKNEDFKKLSNCLAQKGNQESGLKLIFGQSNVRPAGQFTIRRLLEITDEIKELLTACNAVILGTDDADVSYVLLSNDFNSQKFKEELLSLQAIENEYDDGTVRTTAFMFAAQWPDTDIFKALLTNDEEGAYDKNRLTVMHCAAWAGHKEYLELLLARGYTLNLTDSHGMSMLSHAAAQGHTEICQLLIDWGADIEPEFEEDISALSIAAEHGHTATCALLIGKNADIEVKDSKGVTPLLKAAINGHLDTCKTLITLGASLDHIDGGGYSLLSAAACSNNILLYRYLLDKGASYKNDGIQIPPLTSAALHNSTDLLRMLLEQGADIHAADRDGDTALMLACINSHLYSVQILLEHGAKIDQVNHKSENALIFASHCNDVAIVNLLLKHGATLFSKQNFGYRALEYAVQKRSMDIVKTLVNAGVPVDPKKLGLAGKNNLLLKLDYGDINSDSTLEILQFLLNHGAPLHHTNEEGNDALMLAVDKSNVPAVGRMLKYGAKVGQESSKGNALQLAIHNLKQHVDSWSLFNGADGILFLLLKAIQSQHNFDTLYKEALYFTKDFPLGRDLILDSRVWLYSASETVRVKSPDYQKLIQRNIPLLLKVEKIPASSYSSETFRDVIASADIPASVLELMQAFMEAFPLMLAPLSGIKAHDKPFFALSVTAGMIVSALEPKLLSIENWQPYAEYPLHPSISQTLHSKARKALRLLVESAVQIEENFAGNSISHLFETCVQKTLQGREPVSLAEHQCPAGAISDALQSGGIYGVLSDKIEAAWVEAWDTVAKTQSQILAAAPSIENRASSSSSTSSSSSNASSITSSASSNWADIEMNDIFDSNAAVESLGMWISSMSAPQRPTFMEGPLATALLAEFRRVLKRTMNEPGNLILELPRASADVTLELPGASAEVANVYRELLFRQLHMLAQFIDDKNKPQSQEELTTSDQSGDAIV